LKIGERSNEQQTFCKAVQTEPILEEPPQPESLRCGSQENPFILGDEDLDPHDAISEDEDIALEPIESPNPIDDDKYFLGTAFEKVDQFDHYLDDPNPWHPDLKRPLFNSQVIGFRWMASRHSKGGGLVGDKVGCGKVISPSLTTVRYLSESRHIKL